MIEKSDCMALPKYNYNEVIQYWKSLNIQTENDLRNALDSYRILFAYHSGIIENNQITYHDVREIFENGKIINFTGELKTLFEISNQKDCYEYLTKRIIKKEPITEKLIKKIHEILTKGTYDEKRFVINHERPGEYKKHDYIIGRNEVGSKVENVGEDMNELLDEISNSNRNDDDSLILIAAFLHNVIEEIHPFADGNGRVGRTLANYYLMIHNLPPIVIYNEDKKYYYEALEKFDEDEELSPMVKFFKYEMEKTWEKALDKKHQTESEKVFLSNYFSE